MYTNPKGHSEERSFNRGKVFSAVKLLKSGKQHTLQGSRPEWTLFPLFTIQRTAVVLNLRRFSPWLALRESPTFPRKTWRAHEGSATYRRESPGPLCWSVHVKVQNSGLERTNKWQVTGVASTKEQSKHKNSKNSEKEPVRFASTTSSRTGGSLP